MLKFNVVYVHVIPACLLWIPFVWIIKDCFTLLFFFFMCLLYITTVTIIVFHLIICVQHCFYLLSMTQEHNLAIHFWSWVMTSQGILKGYILHVNDKYQLSQYIYFFFMCVFMSSTPFQRKVIVYSYVLLYCYSFMVSDISFVEQCQDIPGYRHYICQPVTAGL